jgi:hypothetical protein
MRFLEKINELSVVVVKNSWGLTLHYHLLECLREILNKWRPPLRNHLFSLCCVFLEP